MKSILARVNREVLRQFTWSRVLLAFDYDGTLAPIVSSPAKATMRPSTRSLIQELVELYPCIVISGRARSDAIRRLRGVGLHEIVGNHGMEPGHARGKIAATVASWRPLLDERLAAFRGVEIEDKGFSVAIHYRQSRQKKMARDAILRAASTLRDVRLIGGKQVVNILLTNAPHKGMALERQRVRLQCDTAIYVGDDEADEDVFALDQPGQLLGIRVGRSRSSAAAYFIESQREIDELLRVLLEFRKEAGVAQRPRKRK